MPRGRLEPNGDGTQLTLPSATAAKGPPRDVAHARMLVPVGFSPRKLKLQCIYLRGYEFVDRGKRDSHDATERRTEYRCPNFAEDSYTLLSRLSPKS